MTISNFQNTQVYARAAANAIRSFINARLQEKGVVRVALSGGISPLPVYRELRNADIPWNRVQFFLEDERYAPLNSKESNYGMIEREFTGHLKNLRKFYHFNTRDDIKTIVDQYEKMLRQFDSPLFDLVLLGLGEDGHTASLFPHSEALHETRRLVLHTQNLSQNAQDRMTLTFPAIMDSEKIILLISGKEKRETVNRLLHETTSIDELPAKKILEHPNVDFFLDLGAVKFPLSPL